MRFALITARVLSSGHASQAILSNGWHPTSGLVCPIDDRAYDEAASLCRAHGWPIEAAASIHDGMGADSVLAESTIVVITDGQDYVCAEIVRRAENLGRVVLVHAVDWQQGRLFGLAF